MKKVIGSIGAFRQGNIHRSTAELGYYIAEEYWDKGISCRVLEKAGFQYEGTLRNNVVKNGKVLDMKMYARLK